MTAPYYQDDQVALYLGDARELAAELATPEMVIVTDPPYGIGWRTEDGSFRSKSRLQRGESFAIIGDDEPFEPATLLALGLPMVLFGANHYADRLPASASWIVWDKKPAGWSNDQGDAELAWTNLGGPTRIIRKAWGGGGTLRKENGAHSIAGITTLHPSQKPIDLMLAIIARCPAGPILDPYAGSGSTLVAAKASGRKSVGIEIDERYCETAARRCRQDVLGLV